MKKLWVNRSLIIFSAIVWILVLITPLTSADEGKRLKARLSGFQEPPAISTNANGMFEASVSETAISYSLSYSGLEGNVTQAHIHFGQRGVNGGISVFLCTNLSNGPAGTQLCPPSPATITGTITAADLIGPTGQGIAPGEFAELLSAIRTGNTYVNVHSTKFPGGEIRGQVEGNDSGDND